MQERTKLTYMKFKSLIFIFSIALNTSLHAQTFSVDFSEKIGMSFGTKNGVQAGDGWLMAKIIYDPTKLYQDVSNLSLELVNKKMETVKTVEVPVSSNKFLRLSGLYKTNGVTVILYAYKMNRADKEYSICGRKINELDLTFGPEINLGQYVTRFGNNTPNFVLKHSMDSSRYFLLTEAIQKDKEKKQFYLKVMNNDLSIHYQKTVELDAATKFVKIQSSTLDSYSNVYVEYRIYEKEVEDEELVDEDKKITEYQTVITQYKSNGSQQDVKLDLQGNFLHTARLMVDKTGKLHIGGTFKPGKRGRIKGIFFCSYDPITNKASSINKSEIPADIVALLDRDDVARKEGKDPGISANFNPTSFSERANGSLDFTLEHSKTVLRPVSALMDNSASLDKYYSNAILNINVSKTGTMQFTRIPKDQVSESDRTRLSHHSFYVGNKMIFLYNDNTGNAERDINKKPETTENFRKSALMAAVLNEKGDVTRQIIYEHGDDKYVSIISTIRPAAINALFITKMKTGAVLSFENTRFGILKVTN